MKNSRKSVFYFLICMMIFCVSVFLSSVNSFANSSEISEKTSDKASAPNGAEKNLGFIIGVSNDQPAYVFFAVAIPDKNGYMAISSGEVYDCVNSVEKYVYLSNSGEQYDASLSEVNADFGFSKLEINAPSGFSCLQYEYGHKGDKVWAYYIDNNGEGKIDEGELAGIKKEGAYYGYDLKEISAKDRNGIAVLVNENGACVGIISDSGFAWAIDTTPDEFSKSGKSGKLTDKKWIFIIIGAVLVVFIIVIIVLATSKGNKNPSRQQPEFASQPVNQAVNVPPAFGGETSGTYVQQGNLAENVSYEQHVVQASDNYNDYSEKPVKPEKPEKPEKPRSSAKKPGNEAISIKIYGRGGQMDGRIYTVSSDEILFGRDQTALIRYSQDVKGISRLHCKVFWEKGVLMLVDLGSSYGTYMGDSKLNPNEPVELKDGSCFYLGGNDNAFLVRMG